MVLPGADDADGGAVAHLSARHASGGPGEADRRGASVAPVCARLPAGSTRPLTSAQVVMPDAKESERDVVVSLGAEHAAGSVEEAGERGAVAALARVAGERALHRVLPRAYTDLWHALAAQARPPG